MNINNVGSDCWNIINRYKWQFERAWLYQPVIDQLKTLRRYEELTPYHQFIRIICYQPQKSNRKKIMFDYKLCYWCGRNMPDCKYSGNLINGKVFYCQISHCPHVCPHNRDIRVPLV